MSIFDDGLGDITKEIEEGASFWIAKSMKDDGDFFMFALLERPIQWREPDPFNKDPQKVVMRTRWGANVAKFDDEGKEFERVMILETGPRHMGAVTDAIEEDGTKKVYKAKRKGVRDDKNTRWLVKPVRDLTDAEITMFKGIISGADPNHKLHEIREGAQNEAYAAEAKDDIAKEVARLGWTKEQYIVANTTFFKSPAQVQIGDMDIEGRNEFIKAMAMLQPGDTPDKCTGEINLDADDDFF